MPLVLRFTLIVDAKSGSVRNSPRRWCAAPAWDGSAKRQRQADVHQSAHVGRFGCCIPSGTQSYRSITLRRGLQAFGKSLCNHYNIKCWLDQDKSILRQITSAQSDARFYFVVKFYPTDPTEMEEEYTRYLLSLQIRRDLSHGEFICGNENTAALLVSFIVQAECGDFSLEDYPDHTYLSVTNFVPNQTAAFQVKVMENHKKLM
ncbi:FERM central domain-containing protein [Ditylenchus destructor]|nr:FERM central domain-containing protein [Ditylenchus destructor]